MSAIASDTRLPHRVKDIRGRVFTRLTAVSYSHQNKFHVSVWNCMCVCGKTIQVPGPALVNGHTRSCGCLYQDTRKSSATTHGGCYEPEYYCWKGMMKRCYDKDHVSYLSYGGSGVTVQASWHDYRQFQKDIGHRPSSEHSIDRFPNRTSNYEAGNVRWASRKEQQRNMNTNVTLTHQGRTLTMAEWTEIKGWSRSKIKNRKYAGWSDEKILVTP